jgi:hypothetical protein
MKYKIEKGSSKVYFFMGVGIFLASMSTYELYQFLQTNQFVSEFPGDWDMPLGIMVGLFLIIRSLSFISESKSLFIEITEKHLIYRTNRSESIQKIDLSNIDKIQKSDAKIKGVTKNSVKLTIIDFNTVRLRPETEKSIWKSLNELNSKKHSKFITS